MYIHWIAQVNIYIYICLCRIITANIRFRSYIHVAILRSKRGPNYGYWADWDSPQALAEEAAMAKEYMVHASLRGPHPDVHPTGRWRGMRYDRGTGRWTHKHRHELPEEYKAWVRSGYWTDPDALSLESELAAKFMVPWGLRGPPGPDDGGPLLWRDMSYRPKQGKWMSRGGDPTKQAAQRGRYFVGKGKSNGTKSTAYK